MADRGDLILLSAPDRAAMCAQLAAAAHTPPPPADPGLACRLAIIAETRDEVGERLQQARARLNKDAKPAFNLAGRILYAENARPGRAALLFPGFGAHHPTMMADLLAHFAPARAWLDALPAALAARLRANPLLFAGTGHAPAKADFAQMIDAALAGDLTLARVVRALCPGLRPEAMLGHSYGETALLLEAGLTADTVPLLELLPALMARIAARPLTPVAMLAVNAAGLARLGAPEAIGARVALDNCPQQTILCGPPAALNGAEIQLREAGLACFRLPDLAIAVHTPDFPVPRAELAALYTSIALAPAATAIYSCTTTERFPSDPAAISALLAEQWSRPVRFADTVRRMAADGIDTFIEIGAGGHLTGFVRDALRGQKTSAIAANQDGRPTLGQLRLLVGQMFVAGVAVAPGPLQAAPAPAPTISAAAPTADPSPIPADGTVEPLVRALVADLLDVDAPELIDAQRGFFDLGLGSLDVVDLADRLARALNRPVAQTVAFDFPSIAALVAHLQGESAASAEIHQRHHHHDQPIAIIGIGCRLPGGIDDPDSFWDFLMAGRSGIGALPADRWPLDHITAAGIDPAEMAHIFRAGCLDQISDFDPGFFGISRREALTLDPQQRLLLEVAHEALDHAAIAAARLKGSATAIYVGISNSDYAQRLSMAERLAVGGYIGTGNTPSTAAGRLAFVLGCHGPALAIDTACSSSLVALHLACRALRDGEAELALAGGVNLLISPETSIFLARAGALSPQGQCHTFDAAADGYVRGEGAGMVVLKRLDDATRDGDRVLAVVRGSAVNHDGRTSGFTVPNGTAQRALIHAALADAGLSPADVDVVETHGTGTALGDPIEANALGKVYAPRSLDRAALLIGSVKTNFGHLEAAAGMAGLIKQVLQLGHGQVAPSLNFARPNPLIGWHDFSLTVAASAQPWPDKPGGRIGAVSSFGISGTNAHVLLGAAPPVSPPTAAPLAPRRHHLLTLSAKSPGALAALLTRTQTDLPAPAAAFADYCATRLLRRDHHSCRAAVVAVDGDDARAQLARHARAIPALPRRAPLAFLFSGQGAQMPGMGAELHAGEPVFAAVIDACAAAFAPHLDRPLTDLLWGGADLTNTAHAQPALFALEMALVRLWADWGIRPDVVIGHSIGEFAAACTAGLLSLDDAARLVAARGRLMGALPAGGAMLAVAMTEAEAQAFLDRHRLDLDIAAINAPRALTLSGHQADIERASAQATAEAVRWRRLDVSHAFHSALMEPILGEFARLCADLPARPATLEMVSTLTARPLYTTPDADYWTRQLREPVRFAAALDTIRQRPLRQFVEIGPRPVLTVLGQADDDDDTLWLASQSPGIDGRQQMQECAAALYCAGHSLNGAALWRDRPWLPHPLPATPFERVRLWIEPGQPAPAAAALAPTTPTATTTGSPPSVPEIVSRLRAAAAADRAALALDYLTRMMATILGGARSDMLDSTCALNRLGLDSLMALGVRNELIADFALDLPLSALTGDAISLSVLAAKVVERIGETDAAAAFAAPAEAGAADQAAPLSYGQRALYVLWEMAPASSAYTLSLPLVVAAPAEPARWRQACGALLAAHPALRTHFPILDGQPVQRVATATAPDWRQIDAADWDDEALERGLAAAHAHPFDLGSGPVARFCWFDRGARGAVLLISLHHIIGDGWSLEIIRRQLPALLAGQSVPPSPGPIAHQRRQLALLAGAEGERLWRYWQEQLTPPPPPLSLPTTFPRPAAKGFVGAAHHFTLAEDVALGLKALARAEGATVYVACLTAFLALLHRLSGQNDLCVGSPQAGRDHPDLVGLIGYFVDPLVIRSRLDDTMGLRALLAATRRVVGQGLDHAAFPFALLVERLNPPRAANRSPLFDASFNFIAAQAENGAAPVRELAQADGKFDLTLNVKDGASMECWLGYDAQLFSPAEIARLAAGFTTLLAQALAAPDQPLAALVAPPGPPVLAGPELGLGAADMVPTLIAARAAARPDEIAVCAGEAHLSRAELARASASLARRLVRAGIGPGKRVGVAANRDATTVQAMVAIWRLGATFVPLEPKWPQPLRDQVARDHAIAMVLDRAGLEALPADDGLPAPDAPVDADSPAYLLFTSGSTGAPKGVVVPHRAVANYLRGMAPRLGLDGGGNFALASTLAADLGLTMVLPALCLGGTLHLIDDATALDGAAFARVLRDHRIDHLKIVPSHLAALNATAPALPARTLVLGGEAVAPALVGQWQRAGGPDLRIFNHYGPTETTIGVAWAAIAAADGLEAWPSLPLAEAGANTRLYLLDAGDRPVPAGAVGQLFVGGAALASGYAESPQALGRIIGGDRLYPTGDLARQHPDGRLEILGRADRQIKIRGQRLEPGHLEALLLAQPGVRQAVVTTDADGAQASRLLAFVTGDADGGQLLARLAPSLPGALVPERIRVLSALPLTANGKTDIAALRALAREQESPARVGLPRDAVELELAALWARALDLPVAAVGIDDDFFALGGHSLLAVRLLAWIEQRFARKVGLTALLLRPTVAALAPLLRGEDGGTIPVLVPLAPGDERAVPLLLVPGAGGSLAYLLPLARQLGGKRAVWGLNALGQHDDAIPATIAQAADRYAEAIAVAWPGAKVALAGHSFGALVAFALADRLAGHGVSVDCLALLDNRAPEPGQKAPERSPCGWLRHIGLRIAKLTRQPLPAGLLDGEDYPAAQAALIGHLVTCGLLPADTDTAGFARFVEIYRANAIAAAAYAPDAALAAGPRVAVISAATRDGDLDDVTRGAGADLGWSRLLAVPPMVVETPGTHLTMFDEAHAQALATRLDSLLAAARPEVSP